MTDQDNALFQQNLFDIYTGILFNNQSFAAGLRLPGVPDPH